MTQQNRQTLSSALPLFLYVAAIGVAETLLFLNPVASIYLHSLLLPLIALHYMMWPTPANRPLLVLALLPLLRLLSMMTPQPDIAEIYWVALIGIPLLVSITLAAHTLNLSAKEMRLGLSNWQLQIGIALTGIPLGLMAAVAIDDSVIPKPEGAINTLVYIIILAIFSGFTEELLFRGLFQSVLEELFGLTGIIPGNICFTVMYISTKSPVYLVFVGVIGLFFSWCVWRTNSIWGAVLAHIFISLSIVLISN